MDIILCDTIRMDGSVFWIGMTPQQQGERLRHIQCQQSTQLTVNNITRQSVYVDGTPFER